MSPPVGYSGWRRLNESSFLLKVQESHHFQRLIGRYSKALKVPLDDNNLQGFAEDLCRCCLQEADILDEEGPVAAALQEARHYKQKLTEARRIRAFQGISHFGASFLFKGKINIYIRLVR